MRNSVLIILLITFFFSGCEDIKKIREYEERIEFLEKENKKLKEKIDYYESRSNRIKKELFGK